MTRIIKASEVKPGMTIRWEQGGITYECTVSTVGPAMLGVTVMARRSASTIYEDTEVTVLSEPAPPQPEEPTEFGAKVTVAGRRMIRCTNNPKELWAWRGEALNGDPALWSWGQLTGLGLVTVIPDQGWTVPGAPEVPDRIEEWDTWEDVPKCVAVTTPGLFCHYRKNQGVVEVSYPKENPDWMKCGIRYMSRRYGPWTRVTNA